jgi:alpha-glucosidase
MALADTQFSGCGFLGDVTGHRHDERGLTIECGSAAVRVVVRSDGVVQVRLGVDGKFGRDHSWAVVSSDAPAASCQLREDEHSLELVGPTVNIRIQKRPCRISFVKPDGNSVCSDEPQRGMSWVGEEIRCYRR